VHVRPYETIFDDVKALAASADPDSQSNGEAKPEALPKKFMISTKASWALSLVLGGEEKVDEARSPVGDAKAIKNKTELEGMRQCHIRDGAALSEYFAWLEEELTVKGTKLDEVEAADMLEKMRS
jgi:Xaa-Pro aminopeptidase